MESRHRSIIKSLIWRILGVVVLAFITYIFTGSLIQTGLITFFHHFSFIFIYYFHERFWFHINLKSKKLRTVLKAFTYEIILGHLVLGLISLIFTGSWTTVTLITITYIENKLWMYMVYESLWNRFSK